MSKDKIYLTVIVLLAIALIAGCALQTQRIKRLSVSEIIVPKEGLMFKTEDGKVIARIRADKKDGGSLAIFNNQGEPVTVMGVFEYGGSLVIFNNQGKLAAGMCASENGGLLDICDNRGTTIWSKP